MTDFSIHTFNAMCAIVSLSETIALFYITSTRPGKKHSLLNRISLAFGAWLVFYCFVFLLFAWPVFLIAESANEYDYWHSFLRSLRFAPVSLAGLAGTVWMWVSCYPHKR